MPTELPPLLHQLIDDAAVFPPGNAPLPEAVDAHREHRRSWYTDLVGPLLVRGSDALSGALSAVARRLDEPVGVVLDTPAAEHAEVLSALDRLDVAVSHVEVVQDGASWFDKALPVARVYVEIPLSADPRSSLDDVASDRAGDRDVVPKFRVGGPRAELFPTPSALAAVICACRDRHLPFKLTAGLHHAVRQRDPETGFVHHGFLNVLAASIAAVRGVDEAVLGTILSCSDGNELVRLVTPELAAERTFWTAFGSCSITEPLNDLIALGLIGGDR